ncbi:hypothetical protein [Streptomyces sp. NPDC056549]|uniref:hypothetical protein n=1 Tax=Streptomyces sp. NPDC056549 TaxID=3345864 RepID=UPI00368BE2A8
MDRVPGGAVGAVVVGVGKAVCVVDRVDGAADGLAVEGAKDDVARTRAKVEGKTTTAGGLVLVSESVPAVEMKADEEAGPGSYRW